MASISVISLKERIIPLKPKYSDDICTMKVEYSWMTMGPNACERFAKIHFWFAITLHKKLFFLYVIDAFIDAAHAN